MITREKKQQVIKDLVDKLSRQKAVIFFDYTGLESNKMRQIRERLREKGIDCQVVKKTLIDLALKEANFKDIKIRSLSGQLALVFGYQEEVLPAKILYDFSKTNENAKILAGLVQGEYLESEAIINLAKLPSRQELLAKAVGSLVSPLSGLVNVLQGNLRSLIFILKNLKPEA